MKEILTVITKGPEVQWFNNPGENFSISPPTLYMRETRSELFEEIQVNIEDAKTLTIKKAALPTKEFGPSIYTWEIRRPRISINLSGMYPSDILNPDEFMNATGNMEVVHKIFEFDKILAGTTCEWESELNILPEGVETLLKEYEQAFGNPMPRYSEQPEVFYNRCYKGTGKFVEYSEVLNGQSYPKYIEPVWVPSVSKPGFWKRLFR